MSGFNCFRQNLLVLTAIGATFSAQALGATATSGDAPVWVQVLYSDASQSRRTGMPGYDASTQGVGVGIDNALSDQWTLGLTYRHLTTDVNADSGNKTDIKSQFVTVQSSFGQERFFVTGGLSYGQSDHDATQRIAGELLNVAYDSAQLGLNATAGYRYPLQGTVEIEPQLVARYARIDTDETRGAGSAGERRHEVGELGAGLRWVGHFDLGPGSMQQQIRLMGYRDFIADQSGTTALLLLGNTPFVTTGAKPKRNSYEVGLGADYRLGALSLGLSWDYFGKSAYSSDTFIASVRYDL